MLALERGSDVEAVACGEVAEGLRGGVHLVIVSAGGEARELQPEHVNPRGKRAVRKQDIASLPEGSAGVRSCRF